MRPFLEVLRLAGVKSLRVQVRITVLRDGDKRTTSVTRLVTDKLGR